MSSIQKGYLLLADISGFTAFRMLSTVEFKPFDGGTEIRWKMLAEGRLPPVTPGSTPTPSS